MIDMIPPEEKAKELIEKFRKEYAWVEKDYSVDLWRDAKACATICVQEIINAFDDCSCGPILTGTFGIEEWQQVKQQLQKP